MRGGGFRDGIEERIMYFPDVESNAVSVANKQANKLVQNDYMKRMKLIPT